MTAFQSVALQNAILAAPGGSIAATFVQRSGASEQQQQQSVGWTLIDSAASSDAFATSVANSVIGGPGAFFDPPNAFGDFRAAVERKLEREVVSVLPVPGA